jgi:hypothetical protein
MRGFDAVRSATIGLALLLAGCGGGPSYAVQTVAPSSTGTGTVGASATTVTAASNGVTTNISLGASSSGSSSVSATTSSSPPSGAPALQSSERQTLSTAGTPIVYVALTFASTVTLPSLPGFTFTIPSPSASSAYFLGLLDPAKGSTYQLGAEGPGLLSGSTVSLSAPAGSVTFIGGTQYVFSLYSTTLAPVVAAPTTLNFSSSAAQTFTVSESGYTGAFSAASSNTNVATVSGPTGSPSTFTVTPLAGGTATIAIADTSGQKTTVAVSVTSATFVPQ